MDLYNAQEGPGTVAAEEGAVSLYGPDGEYRTTLTLQDDGTLTDSAGGVALNRFAWDHPMLLPTAADALTETAQFPDDFSGVTIGYPAAMECHAMDNMTNALSFNAIMESGTSDYWTNILIGFMPIDGYDPYMTQGLSVAKPYMEHMLGAFLESMYSGKLLKTIATDCPRLRGLLQHPRLRLDGRLRLPHRRGAARPRRHGGALITVRWATRSWR